MGVARFEVYLVTLDPTVGSEIRKTRPCLVVSPDDMNQRLRTTLVAPMTTGGRPYPFRLRCRFQGANGFILLDQIRSVDQKRLVRRLGVIDEPTSSSVLTVLQGIFAP